MKRVVVFVAVIAALVVGIKVMADATQNRPDQVRDGTTTVIDYSVSTHDYQRGEPAAASALWAVCSSTVAGEITPQPDPIDDHWQVTVTPAIGEHGENRLIGCLQDLTLDRVIGNVISISHSS